MCLTYNIGLTISFYSLTTRAPSDKLLLAGTSLPSYALDAVFKRYNTVLPRIYVLYYLYADNAAPSITAAYPISLTLSGAAGFRVLFCVLIPKGSLGSPCLILYFWIVYAIIA